MHPPARAQIVMAYFECPENPAAEATLSKYKDVVCGSDEHADALPAMLIGMLLYVVGFYLAFLRAAWIAPQQWTNTDFREMWKFMLTRWRPDVWCPEGGPTIAVALASHSDGARSLYLAKKAFCCEAAAAAPPNSLTFLQPFRVRTKE